jgi:hypothetical protein
MRLLHAAVIAMTAIGPLPLKAAEVRVDPSDNGRGAVLEGKIETGDFEKVRNFFFSEYPLQIYLASPGGNLAEAMRIGHLVRSLNLLTMAPGEYPGKSLENRMHILKQPKADYMCASECFFVYVAGIKRFVDSVFGKAFLGIQRPHLSVSKLQAATGDEAIASTNHTRTVVQDYLEEMGVPAKYAEEMFRLSQGDIRWLSHEEIQADFDGFVPELRDWVDTQCDKRSDTEKNILKQMHGKGIAELTPTERAMAGRLVTKRSQQFQCENELQSELAKYAYVHALELKGPVQLAPSK